MRAVPLLTLLVALPWLGACSAGGADGAGTAEEAGAPGVSAVSDTAPAAATVPGAEGAGSTASEGSVRPEAVATELTTGDTLAGRPSWTRQNLDVLVSTVDWALAEELDTLPVGERVARLGERFVGTPYIPRTLDPPGPERLVVNLRAFDCVTFVESMLTLARVVEVAGASATPPGADALADAYQRTLTSVRYRGGQLDGYASRLHYFSEWIADNQAKGFVRDVTAQLGGIVDPEPRTFMTAHRDAYTQLADPGTFQAVADMERRLAGTPRSMIPEDRVADVQDRIRSGDIIAATSTLPGLDVAHTGIALWRDGVLHLMHAPLVGEAVQISEASLAARLLRLSAQDGIMVARPLEVDSSTADQARGAGAHGAPEDPDARRHTGN